LFVSPNSVREKLFPDIHEILSRIGDEDIDRLSEVIKDMLQVNKCGISPSSRKPEYEGSTYEVFLAENKIKEINNLISFIDLVLLDSTKAAHHNISMYYDAYFFGIKRDTDAVNLIYKIADFDSIAVLDNDEVYVDELTKSNISAAYEAIWKFINTFVYIENADNYQKIVSTKLSELAINI